MRTEIHTAVLALLALSASARTFDVTLWRGETLATRIPGFCELGEAPKGISVREGRALPVSYAPEALSLRRETVCDRVVWDVHAKTSVPFERVAEITASADIPAGIYECGMMRIRVIDRVLPPAAEWKYYLDLWQHPWAVARVARAKPFSKAHFAAMKPILATLATAGQKALTVTLVEQPWDHQCRDAYGSMIGRTRMKDGSWKFDYSVFDKYVAFGRSCGIGPDIACYTLCPWECVCRYRDEEGKEQSMKCDPGTKEFDLFWGDFLDDFSAHLHAKGWFGNTLIAMDEREPEDVKKIADFVQKHAPGMRISMAGNRKPSDFKGIRIDSYAQILFTDCVTPAFLEEARQRHAEGLITTHYVCCAPLRPNTFMFSKDGEPFWNGAFAAFSGLDGFLRWAWNSWPENPEVDATYWNWQSGDTFLVYPGGAPSWRFLELRNGIVASEKVRILREKGLFADELAKAAKLFDVKAANDGKCEYWRVRQGVLDVVNK